MAHMVKVSLTALERNLNTLENTASGTREAYNNLLKEFTDEVEERAKLYPTEAEALRNRLEHFTVKIEAAKRKSLGNPLGLQDQQQKNPIAPGFFQQEVTSIVKNLLKSTGASTSINTSLNTSHTYTSAGVPPSLSTTPATTVTTSATSAPITHAGGNGPPPTGNFDSANSDAGQSPIMSGVNFKFETGLKLPELHGTDAQEITSFFRRVECYHDLLNTQGQGELVRFLVKYKVCGQAYTRLGEADDITTLAELQRRCMTNVAVNESSEKLFRELILARQNRKSLVEFAGYLEKLAKRFAECQIREIGHTTADAQRVTRTNARKLALFQFKEGCHDEVKLILKANDPGSLEDALKIAEASNLDGHTSRISYTNGFRQNKNQQANGNRHNGSQQKNGNRKFNNKGQNGQNSGQNHGNSGNYHKNGNSRNYGNGNNFQKNGHQNDNNYNGNRQGNNYHNRQNNNHNSGFNQTGNVRAILDVTDQVVTEQEN